MSWSALQDARKRTRVCGHLASDADFTGTIDKPNEFVSNSHNDGHEDDWQTEGNLNVLRDFVHLNETTINYIKNLPMTEKGKKVISGDYRREVETTFSFEVITTPLEYWLMRIFARQGSPKYWLREIIQPKSDRRSTLFSLPNIPRNGWLENLPEENEPDSGTNGAELNVMIPQH